MKNKDLRHTGVTGVWKDESKTKGDLTDEYLSKATLVLR